jgi:hypothetical protein
MRRLNEILDNINSEIIKSLAYPNPKMYNQADLQIKDGKTFPIVNNGNSNGFAISLDNNIALQSYHRVLGSETETDYTKGKGKYPYKIRTYTMKMVWIGTLKRLPSKAYESTDDVKNDVYAAFPVTLKDKELVKTNSESINKIEILNEEFADNITKQLSLDLVVFSIDYEVKQNIRCN